jgi:TadE-like protein
VRRAALSHNVTAFAAAPRRRRRGQTSRGTSLVEFALVGPILLLLVFGCIDFGRAYYHMNQLNNAAREGMRLAILQDHVCNTLNGPLGSCTGSSTVSNETTVCQSILNEGALISTASWHCTEGGTLPASGTGTAGNAYVEIDQFASSASSTVACDSSLASSTTMPRGAGNRSIEVKIDYYFRPLTPVFGQLFPSSFHLEATSCGRAEY